MDYFEINGSPKCSDVYVICLLSYSTHDLQ